MIYHTDSMSAPQWNLNWYSYGLSLWIIWSKIFPSTSPFVPKSFNYRLNSYFMQSQDKLILHQKHYPLLICDCLKFTSTGHSTKQCLTALSGHQRWTIYNHKNLHLIINVEDKGFWIYVIQKCEIPKNQEETWIILHDISKNIHHSYRSRACFIYLVKFSN